MVYHFNKEQDIGKGGDCVAYTLLPSSVRGINMNILGRHLLLLYDGRRRGGFPHLVFTLLYYDKGGALASITCVTGDKDGEQNEKLLVIIP